MTPNDLAWYGVRTVVWFPAPMSTFEERVTIWRARSFDDAIERAEAESHSYCEDLDAVASDLVQAFLIGDDSIVEGSEVFSLMRDSDLETGAYVDAFFDTGTERHQRM
jgi:hypothetical protein